MKEIAFKKIAFGNNLNTQFSQWYPLDTFLYHKLKTKLFESVQRNKAKGLLFSGGLDSAVLAAISPGIKAITVSLINQATTDSDVVARFIGHKNEGEDVQYAISAARLLNIEHFHRQVGIEEALEAVPQVIKILKTFDPAIPNDLVVYFGLKQARELGIDEIMTGDGADELFGGYAFMQKIDDLEGYIRKITPRMRFSSNKIGEFFKIRTVQPFLDKKFIYFSLKISPQFKIKRENAKIRGKWILRKAFEDVLPANIIWQNKRPLEYGSGMNSLREIISSKISDAEFEEKQQAYPVKFLNKEHLYFYEIYRKEVGEIPAPKETEKACPGCAAGLKTDDFHCKICGLCFNEEVIRWIKKGVKQRKA